MDRKVETNTEKLPEKSTEKTFEKPVEKPSGKSNEMSKESAEQATKMSTEMSMGANSFTGGQSEEKTPISAEQLLTTANKELKQETKPTPR